MEDYKSLLLNQARIARRDGREPRDSSPSRKDERRTAAELRSQLAPLRKAARVAEESVEALGRRKDALQAKLGDPTLYSGSPDQIAAVQRELGDVEKALEAAEVAWFTAHEALDDASRG
jgi:ATP-binding cassette subfamily F protein 3